MYGYCIVTLVLHAAGLGVIIGIAVLPFSVFLRHGRLRALRPHASSCFLLHSQRILFFHCAHVIPLSSNQTYE